MVNSVYVDFKWLNNMTAKIIVNHFHAVAPAIINCMYTDTTANIEITQKTLKALLWKDLLGSWSELYCQVVY